MLVAAIIFLGQIKRGEENGRVSDARTPSREEGVSSKQSGRMCNTVASPSRCMWLVRLGKRGTLVRILVSTVDRHLEGSSTNLNV